MEYLIFFSCQFGWKWVNLCWVKPTFVLNSGNWVSPPSVQVTRNFSTLFKKWPLFFLINKKRCDQKPWLALNLGEGTMPFPWPHFQNMYTCSYSFLLKKKMMDFSSLKELLKSCNTLTGNSFNVPGSFSLAYIQDIKGLWEHWWLGSCACRLLARISCWRTRSKVAFGDISRKRCYTRVSTRLVSSQFHMWAISLLKNQARQAEVILPFLPHWGDRGYYCFWSPSSLSLWSMLLCF